MKKSNLIWPFLGVALLFSCQSKENKEQKFEERAFQLTVDSETGIYRMQSSDAQGNEVIAGAEYHYSIQRAPSDELPRVKDAEGNLFVDNVIDVKISRNGKSLFAKRFTKKDFASLVEPSFLSKAILEGLVFDKVVDGRLRFAASVCQPQTDIFIPLSLTVSSDGQLRIEKGSVLDEEIPGGESSE